MLRIAPSPLTAALAGAFSALVLPLLRSWFGGDSGFGLPFIMALIVTVALPAHLFVIGTNAAEAPGTRSLNVELLKRIGAWLVAAIVVAGVRFAL